MYLDSFMIGNVRLRVEEVRALTMQSTTYMWNGREQKVLCSMWIAMVMTMAVAVATIDNKDRRFAGNHCNDWVRIGLLCVFSLHSYFRVLCCLPMWFNSMSFREQMLTFYQKNNMYFGHTFGFGAIFFLVFSLLLVAHSVALWVIIVLFHSVMRTVDLNWIVEAKITTITAKSTYFSREKRKRMQEQLQHSPIACCLFQFCSGSLLFSSNRSNNLFVFCSSQILRIVFHIAVCISSLVFFSTAAVCFRFHNAFLPFVVVVVFFCF